jgi:hypothetical protein
MVSYYNKTVKAAATALKAIIIIINSAIACGLSIFINLQKILGLKKMQAFLFNL